jgi:hypothetical protein
VKVRILDEAIPRAGGPSPLLDHALSLATHGAIQLVAELPERDGLTPRLRAWLGDARTRQVGRLLSSRARAPRWTRQVDLVPGPSDFAAPTIRIGPEDALWLGQPVLVYVENSRNDWGFLRKAVPGNWGHAFAAAERRVAFEPVGGGITEMLQIARGVLAGDVRRRRRSWFMFDSDGPPDAPSKDATSLSELLTQLGIPFHPLRRRAIENYVPRRQRREWVHRNDAFVQKRTSWMDAFDALPDVERWAFAMKKGEPQRPPPLNGRLPPDPESRSAKGATPLSDVWRDPAWVVPERDLDEDGSRAERIELAQSLLAMVA